MTRIGDLANKLAKDGRAGEIERALEKIDPAKLSGPEREEWWHIYGITAFEGGRDDVALERFRQGHEQFPNSCIMKFALGQQFDFPWLVDVKTLTVAEAAHRLGDPEVDIALEFWLLGA